MPRILGILAACAVLALSALPAVAQNVEKAPPSGAYKKVSELVKLPDFLPGLGHPGVPDPHYHIVLWHVSKAQEQLVAK
jgi:hypothetical protein